ncbi:MAG: AAA family ATPase [bacterium]|nr:AAA family ATPase [bacterium]
MPQLNSSLIIPLIIIVAGLVYTAIKKKGVGGSFPKMGRGVTPFLDSYTTDFTQMARVNRLNPVVGREEEVMRLAQILSRREKNNAILIGPPGVGKTAIVEGLASRILEKEVPTDLQGKRVLALDVATLLSGTKYRGEFEERAKKIVQEIISSNRSIILFIDEIHSVVQSHGTEGAVNFSDILKPALARGDLQMIGATTDEEYEKYIKTDSSLERRFQPVEVREPTEAETIVILKGVKDKYREYHKVEFTDAAIEAAVKLSQKYIKERRLPDKALDILDESGSMVKVSHIHSDVAVVLYETAVKVHPEAAKLWTEIQKLDARIAVKSSAELIKQREATEAELGKLGVVTADYSDIERVIGGWKRS